MHELSVTKGIFNTVLESANRAGAKKVNQVNINMGACLDYIPEIIQKYYDELSKGTIAYGAKIIVNVTPVKIMCNDCKNIMVGNNLFSNCPKCQSRNLILKNGREILIENIEIED